MFDCTQDIRLLHGSLLSAANPESDNLYDCADVKDAVRIVYNSIKMIIHRSLKGAKNEKEKINSQLHCNERLHAALFFITLRSHGIKSQTADEFYDSIIYNWPSVNLKFYVELSFKCDWSEYFIMCGLQLPSEILLEVLKMIFEISFEDDVKYYSWHLILQILIFKSFEVSYNKEVNYPFNFDFVVESAISKKSHDECAEKNFERQVCDEIQGNQNICEKNDKIIHKYDDAIEEDNNVSDSGDETLTKNSNSNQFYNEITQLDDEDTEEESEYLIPFSYKISDDDDDDEYQSTKTKDKNFLPFEELCYSLYDNIAFKLEKSNEINALKVLLHVIKTISKCIKTGKIAYENILPFQNYVKLMQNYISTDTNENRLTIELTECSVAHTMHACATVSWNICLNYLIFIIEYYNEDLCSKIPSSGSLNDAGLFYESLACVSHSLSNLNSPFLKSDVHITLFCKIISLAFEGSSYAVSFLLIDPVILKMKNVLATLEENCYMIDLRQSYSCIVRYIMSGDYSELKQNLLKILYKCLQMNELDVYNSVIGYILSNYGLTEEFQLPGYKDLLSELVYETPTQEEIENKIPALLIQNPKNTLKYLIDEALFQGSEGKIFIQLLKHLGCACFYIEESHPVCILHEILNDYFNKPKLEPLFYQNMPTLYTFLVQVHAERQILFPCSFFNECIIPRLYPKYEKIGLLLECTYALLPALLSDGSFLKDTFHNFIVKLGILLNYFIVEGDGEMKSLIICILKDLEVYQEKNKQIDEKEKLRLWSSLATFGEMTCVYFEKFLPENIEFISRAAVWIQCCKNEDLSNFQRKFSVKNLNYTSLVNTLIEVLPHLTKKEWAFCHSLLKICYINQKLQEEVTYANNNFQFCGSDLDTYSVVSAVVTSVHFIQNGNDDKLLYMRSCVSNFLKNAVFQEETVNPHLLLSVALDICHLISSTSLDTFKIYQNTLLEIQKKFSSYSSESDENYYISKLLNHALSCLPNLK